MKFLIIGDGSSVHIKNYINVVLKDNQLDEITLFDTNPYFIEENENYIYYKKNCIKLILNNGLNDMVSSKLIKKIPKFRNEYHIKLLSKKIKELGKFDFCIIHYVDRLKIIPVFNNKNLYKKIVPVFWGSDLLRNSKIEELTYKRMFDISHKIIFNTENMKYYFEKIFKEKYLYKSEVIKFPTMSFEKITDIENSQSKNELRNNFGLPLEKYLVICGHSANTAEQHEEIIESISKCSKEILKNTHFIFPMSYGTVNLTARQQKIQDLLKDKKIESTVLQRYLNNIEMLQIIYSSDIYISVIKTDAFSSVMQESLYSNLIVILGKWLNYRELEESQIYVEEINRVDILNEKITQIINEFSNVKKNLKYNRNLISEISSPEKIRQKWLNTVFT